MKTDIMTTGAEGPSAGLCAEDGLSEAELRQLHMSEDQTLLSSERTYAGWLRTALAAVAVGLGFAVLFRSAEAAWAAKAMASVFLVLAIGILIAADRRAAEVHHRLASHFVSNASLTAVHAITWVSVAATVGVIATIWFLA